MNVLIENGAVKKYPYTMEDLKKDNPNVSFCNDISEKILNDYNVFKVTEIPVSLSFDKHVKEEMPIFNSELNRWEQSWTISDLSENEISELKTYQCNKLWEEIKQIRQHIVEDGVKVSVNNINKWFHTDTFSRTQWLGLIVQGDNLPSGIMWKTMDNSFIELTPSIVLQVFSNLMIKEQAAFINAELLKSQLLTAENPAAINIYTGWPETFTNN